MTSTLIKSKRNKTLRADDGKTSVAAAILVFCGLLACLYAIYSPVYRFQYAFADDYFCLLEKLRNPLWVEAHNAQYFLQGRALSSLFFIPEMWNVKVIADFVPVRVLGVFYIGLCSFCFYLALRTVKWTGWQSFGGAICLAVTAGLQVHSTWAVASHQVLATVCAFSAWYFLNKVGQNSVNTINADAPSFSRRLLSVIERVNLVPIALSLAFMFSAVAIYQPAAMFFWVFTAITLTAESGSFFDKLRFFLLALVICGLALSADFGTFFLAKQYYGAAALLSGRSHLMTDPLAKLSWFINGPLVDAFNFFRLVPSRSLAWKSALLIAFGVILGCSGSWRQRIGLFACVSALVPLTYLPNLLVAENFTSYRSEIALLALTTLLLLVAVRNGVQKLHCRDRVFTCAAFGLAIVLSLTAYFNLLNFFAVPQTLELTLLREQVQGKFGINQSRHPLLFKREDSLAPFVRYDEFGMPSSAQTFARTPMQVLLKLETEK